VSSSINAERTPPQCLPLLLLNVHHLSVSPTYCWTYTTSVSPPLSSKCTPPQCLPHLLLNIHLSVSRTYCWTYTASRFPHLLLNVHHFSVFPTYCWTLITSVYPPTYCRTYIISVSSPINAECTPHLTVCVCGRTTSWEGRHISWCGQGSRTLMIDHLLHFFREGAAWGKRHEGYCSTCLPITTGLCAHQTGHSRQGWVAGDSCRWSQQPTCQHQMQSKCLHQMLEVQVDQWMQPENLTSHQWGLLHSMQCKLDDHMLQECDMNRQNQWKMPYRDLKENRMNM